MSIARASRRCVLVAASVSALISGPLAAQPAPTASTPAQASPAASKAAIPRLPDGRPDLQGLWIKSAGGFQGLFIGSLDGTNFAAGGRGGARGGPPVPQYEYT